MYVRCEALVGQAPSPVRFASLTHRTLASCRVESGVGRGTPIWSTEYCVLGACLG